MKSLEPWIDRGGGGRGFAATLPDSPAVRPRQRTADRPIRRLVSLLLFAALAAALTGCAGGRPVSPAPAIPDLTPEQVLRRAAALRPTGIVTATARIVIERRDERLPAKLALMVRNPDSLRIESVPVLGPPDFFLSMAAGELRVYLPARNAFYRGRATADNLARFFPLPLPPAVIVPLLVGQPPEAGPGTDRRAEVREGRYWVEEYREGKPVRSLQFVPDDGRLLGLRVGPEGESPGYAAEFADPVRIGEVILPQRLTVSSADGSMTVRYTELGKLDELSADPFPLPIPAGIPLIDLD